MLLGGFHLAAVARLAGLSWKWAWGRGTQSAWLGGSGGASGVRRGREVPVVLSGVAIAAGNVHFMCSWVPIDWHPVCGVDGCGPQVRELGLGGAGNHVFCPLCWHSLGAPNLAVEERPRLWGQGLYRFTPSHKALTRAVFPSSLVPAGSPRDLSCLVISPAGTS